MDYRKRLVSKNIKIKTALNKLDNIKPKILFVEDNNKLLGSLTDGDIRRYLLSGGSVEDIVYKACNRKPKKVAKSLNEAVNMLSKNYIAIPIVDKDRNIVDIYVGDSSRKIRRKKLDVDVVINAGGKGTRLDPFTKILPKPLIPVGDLPIIEHIMNRYKDYGCDRFKIIVNYKKELIKSYFKEIDRTYDITFIDEDKPLGTGGGLSLIKNKVKDTFFFITCDSLILVDYSDVLKYHKKNNYDITIVCANKNITIPYGIIDVDKNNELNKIEEKPEYNFLTNTAMYVVEPKIIKNMEKKNIDFPDLIRKEKEKGSRIGIYICDEDRWLDMGVMSELEKMRIKLYGE